MVLNACRADRPLRPVVGLTTYLEQVQTGIWDIRAGFLPADYFEGVTLAGGVAVLLPPQPVDTEIVDSRAGRSATRW